MITLVEILYTCSKCGTPTVWDDDLKGPILCVLCWDKASDKEVESQVAAYKRRYYQEHKDQVAAYKRRYYLWLRGIK